MRNKILFLILIIFISITSIQCSKKEDFYNVKTTFRYSSDAGKSYSDSRTEFKVGETVYMQMNVNIDEKKEKSNWWITFIIVGAFIGLIIGVLFLNPITALIGTFAGAATSIIIVLILGLLGSLLGIGANATKEELQKPNINYIEAELEIPNIQSVDAKYVRGSAITPRISQDTTIYPIRIPIDNDDDWFIQIRYIPNEESEIQMKLIFDDNIPQHYDMINTIRFVK